MVSPPVDREIREYFTQDGCKLEAVAGQSGGEIDVISPRVAIYDEVSIVTHRVHARGVVVQLVPCAR